jgi:hypothetical protein
MTPKEKAKKLVDKMLYCYQGHIDEYTAKQCALIAVEFARQEFRNHCAAEIDTKGSPDDHFDALTQEIEKL